MTYETTPLAADVEFVINNPSLGGQRMYQANIRLSLPTGPKVLSSLKVISVNDVEDYVNNFAVVKTLEVYVGLGMYAKQLYPNRDVIEIELSTLTSNEGAEIVTDVYEAILLDENNPTIDESSYANISEGALDLTDIIKITFQLKHKALEQLRVSSVAGIHRQVKVEDVLKLSLTQAIQNLDVEDSYQPTGVSMHEGSNDTIYDHIIIPHGTKLQDLPGYLQERQYGVYSAGLGHFYKDGSWYIYPLYNTENYESALSTLEVSLIPTNKLFGVETTFTKRGGVTFVLATGDRQLMTEPEKEAIDKGEGVRFSDPKSLFDSFVDVLSEDNKAYASRGNNNTEVISVDGKIGKPTNAPVSVNGITSNKFRELTPLAKRSGMYFNFVWEYSDPSVLFPGMTLRVKFLEGDDVRYFEAVLLGVYSSMSLIGKGITSDRYFCTSALSVFLTKDLGLN